MKARGGLLKGKGAGRNSLGAKLFALLHGVEAQEASIVIPTSPLSSPPSLIAPTPSVPTLHVLCLASRAFHPQHTSLPSVQRLSVRPNFHNTHAFRSNTACALTYILCVPSPHIIAFRPSTVSDFYPQPTPPIFSFLEFPTLSLIPTHSLIFLLFFLYPYFSIFLFFVVFWLFRCFRCFCGC